MIVKGVWSGNLRVVLLAVAFMPRHVWACATCYGAPDAPQTQGLNAGILVLLGVTAVVLSCFVALIVKFSIRARRVARLNAVPTT